MSEKLKTLLKITEINYLETFSTSFKNLSFLKTIKLFFTPKRVLKIYNTEKIEIMCAVLCIYCKIAPIPISKFKNASFLQFSPHLQSTLIDKRRINSY